MIGPYFDGGRVLDLYAGSGGLSIEAVSRGMSHAVLVERDRRAQGIIAENIQMTKEVSKFQLLKMEAERVLEQVKGPFDLVPMPRNKSLQISKKWQKETFSPTRSWLSVKPISL